MSKKKKTKTLAPARPRTLSSGFSETEDGITIIKRGGAGKGGLFMLLWLIGWTVGCVTLVGMVIGDPSLFSFLFALPFWVSWIAVAGLLVWQWFGKELFRVDNQGVYFERYAWVRIYSREVPWDELICARECTSTHTENDKYLYGVEIKTLGKPLRILFDLPDNERKWIVHRLNQFLKGQDDPASGQAKPEPSRDNDDPTGELLTPENMLAEPPSSCRWQFNQQPGFVSFARYGKIAWGNSLVLLFMCLFWNGIVSVFLLSLFGLGPEDAKDQPQGAMWWGMAVFLIPFVAIGLMLLGGFLSNLLEPLHRTTWEVHRSAIARTSSWPLLGFTKDWKIKSIERMEMRIQDGKASQQLLPHKHIAGADYELVLIDRDNVECCSINNLTQGECRWMAYQIISHRPAW